MHQGIFRPNYIFNNGSYFLDFRAQNFSLVFFNFYSFLSSTSPAFWGSKL